MRIKFKWYDLWIGAYYDRINLMLYICIIPMIVIEFNLITIREKLKTVRG